MSLTRIRMPRMHGFSPHCCGLNVMRDSSAMIIPLVSRLSQRQRQAPIAAEPTQAFSRVVAQAEEYRHNLPDSDATHLE
jgi:hypothetical protein